MDRCRPFSCSAALGISSESVNEHALAVVLQRRLKSGTCLFETMLQFSSSALVGSQAAPKKDFCGRCCTAPLRVGRERDVRGFKGPI